MDSYKRTFGSSLAGFTLGALLLAASLLLATPAAVRAQAPVQPEATQFEAVDVTDVVNLSTGDFTYSLPLMEVPGPEGSYPISMSYHSGIGPNQEATWVGLGWTLNAGAINRTVAGYPDEYKGASVYTTTNIKGEETTSLSVGVYYMTAVGPVGMNMSYEVNSGMLGVNGSIAISPPAGDGFTPSVGLQMGTSGFNLSAGGGVGVGEFGVGGRVSAGTSGLSAGASGSQGSLYTGGNVSSNGLSGNVGVSPSAALSVGFSLSGEGVSTSATVGAASVTGGSFNEGDVSIESSGFTVPIPIPSTNFFITLGYSQRHWEIDKNTHEDSYGYLHQASYHGSSSEDKKFERHKQGDYLYPSQDHYSVSAQGMTGSFAPFAKNAYKLKDGADADEKGQLEKTIDGETFNVEDIVYRFIGDPGGNLTGDPDAEGSGWGANYDDIGRYGSKKVIPERDGNSGQITGFVIYAPDGKRYEFRRPVYTLFKYTNSKDKEGGGDYAFYEQTMSMGGAYPDQWLLTAIKGPDYVDRGSNGMGAQDWGYWVKFNYEEDDLPHLWRAPYEEKTQSPTNKHMKSYSWGFRETAYLTSIETATHEARFNAVQSKNRLTPPLSYSDNSELLGTSTNSPCDPDVAQYTFRGNYARFIEGLAEGDTVIGTGNEGIPKSGLENYSYNPREGITTVTLETNDVCGQGYFLFPGSSSFEATSYARGKKLNSIELYIKSSQETPLRSAEFTYDYSLRPRSPASSATASDGAVKGALALKGVEFSGQNGATVTPPYRFEYGRGDEPGEGLNPSWGKYNYDRWGSYRDPGGNSGYDEHGTPQEKNRADKAAAWSLTKITTPTGGTVDIQYESDDYYHVNGNSRTGDGVHDLLESKALTIDNERSENLDSDATIKVGGGAYDEPGDLNEDDLAPGQKVLIAHRSVFKRCEQIDGQSGDWAWVYPISKNLVVSPIVVSTSDPTREEITSTSSVTVSEDDKYKGPHSREDCETTDHTYDVIIPPKVVFGGGARVKSVRTSNGGQTHHTEYNYRDADGYSTGVAVTLPKSYGESKVGSIKASRLYEEGLQDNGSVVVNRGVYSENFFRAFVDHEEAYGRPAPSVLYSQVTVTNRDENGRAINGKTVYQFYTAKEHPYRAFNGSDHSIIQGRPKSTTYYEQITDGANPQFRKVKEEETLYAFSEELHAHGAVEKRGTALGNDGDDNDQERPLGLIQEKYAFDNNEDGGASGRVDHRRPSVFVTGSRSMEYTYTSPTATEPSGQVASSKRSFIWDAFTGQSLASASQKSGGAASVTKRTPAYWRYSGMEDKEMLTQQFQKTTYYASGLDASDPVALKAYSFPAGDVVESTVSTWTDQFDVNGDGYGDDEAWRKNDTYRFVSDYPYQGFPGSQLGYMSDAFPEVSSGFPWEMTSNTTRYDRFSRAIEKAHEDGSHSAVVYGYDQDALVVATASRARRREVRYAGFDGSATSVKRAGQGAESAGSYLGAVPSATPSEGGGYTVELWAKPSSGSITLSSDGRSASTSGSGWQLLSLRGISRGSGISTSGSGYIDELRVHPDYARMSTFTYDPLTWKVTSITDANNISTFFDYDDAGRLVAVRDQDRHLTQRHQYASAYFERDIEQPQDGEQIRFDASESSGEVDRYRWDFNGAIVTQSDPVVRHTFSNTGKKRVTLQLLDEAGRVLARRPQEISVTVGGENDPLSVYVTCSEEVPGEFTCEAFPSGGDGLYTYSWSKPRSWSNKSLFVKGCGVEAAVNVASDGQQASASTYTRCD